MIAPDVTYANLAFWSWNDRLSKPEISRQVREMAKQGWGGFFMHSRVGLAIEYLSDEWYDIINFTIQEAEKNGIKAWLYDEDTFPSGFAGGLLYCNESYRARNLVLIREEDLTERDKCLKGYTYKGIKYLICNRVMQTGIPNFNGGCYIDLMNKEATAAFFNLTLEGYKKHCGDKFGKEILGIFTDEPNYLMYYFQTTPAMPWSECLPDYFYAHKGYHIEDELEKLFFDVGDYQKVRYDHFDCALQLFIHSFTKPYYQWCSENGIALTGHMMAEDDFTYQTQWIGAAMPHYEYMHIPGIDKLEKQIDTLTTVKQVSSVSQQLGRTRTLSESFGCTGQDSAFLVRKWITDWQVALGINMICSHLALYTMRGERKRDYPPNLFYQQPWWDREKYFADYTSRLSAIMAQGKQVVETMVLHTIASGWCNYSPLLRDKVTPSVTNFYSKSLDAVAQNLIQNKIDFHFGDEIIMENNARVEDGYLYIGNYKYKRVIVPPCFTIRSNTWGLFTQAVNTEFHFIGGYPERVDAVATQLQLSGAHLYTDIQEYIDSLQPSCLIIDTYTNKNAKDIYMSERLTQDCKYIFLCNTNLVKEFELHISLNEGKYYVIDLGNGALSPVEMPLDITIYPAGSLMLYETKQEIQTVPLPPTTTTGVAFCGEYHIVERFENLDVALLEQNVMPLNCATVTIDGKCVIKDGPLGRVWHEHFYKATDGTPFIAEYKFVAKTIVPEGAFFAIEMAQNLDSICLNGVPLRPEEEYYKDISFIKVPCHNIRIGENTLTLKGKKYNNISGPGTHIKSKDYSKCKFTEIEAVYLVGEFSVENYGNETFVIREKHGLDSRNLTASGAPFYAGKVELSRIVQSKKHPKFLIDYCAVCRLQSL